MSPRKRHWLYRGIRVVLLALLTVAILQSFPLDFMAAAMAGDLLAYAELAGAVWLAAQLTRIRWIAAYARALAPILGRRARIRARKSVRRIRRLLPKPGDDDRPNGHFAFA